MYVLIQTTTHLLSSKFTPMNKEKNAPPREGEFLKLNHRAWEYITMLPDDEAWKLIKMMLSEEVWNKNEVLNEEVFSLWSPALQIIAMMWNEHLFDN